ncbi:hypothetical protein DCC39_17810 [Pueribacillus theae]|uniref:Uncharacterized protein n=1 Tax=Pueribacillus theae TaxID=2171751 RepID=A0A2U1JLA9_9BACI|nr:hypothetical protein [Pueribacillus theae]PWA05785.1 hypothetical protein DCC39_17810 [Pueribacillus theae]
MWYKLPKKSLFMLIWCFASLIFIYGPWGWNPTPGTFSWIAATEGIMMILTPIVAIIILASEKKEMKIDKNQDHDPNKFSMRG